MNGRGLRWVPVGWQHAHMTNSRDNEGSKNGCTSSSNPSNATPNRRCSGIIHALAMNREQLERTETHQTRRTLQESRQRRKELRSSLSSQTPAMLLLRSTPWSVHHCNPRRTATGSARESQCKRGFRAATISVCCVTGRPSVERIERRMCDPW